MGGSGIFDRAGWQAIERVLPKEWRDLAVQMELIKPVPRQLGAKVNDIGTLLWVLLHHVATEESLKTTVASAAGAGLLDISSVALHGWMCRMGPYLSELLTALLGTRERFKPERWAGYEVIACDSSTVSGPGSQGTDAFLHYSLRLPDLRLTHLEVTDVKEGESLRRYEPAPGQLWLGDRGMCRSPGIAHIVEAGADALLRYHFECLPVFDAEGNKLDIETLVLSDTTRGATRQWEVWAHPQGKPRVKGRIIAMLLPREKAIEARKRLQRKHRNKAREGLLRRAEYVVLFTTVPKTKLSAERLVELYRLRWQVELQIKRDKSLTGIGKPRTVRKDTMKSWLIGKLLAQQLARRLAAQGAAFSP